MSAEATAELRIRANTAEGVAHVNKLTKALDALLVSARGVGRAQGLDRLAKDLDGVGARARAAAAGVSKSAGSTVKGVRTVEQEILRLQNTTLQAALTAEAKRRLGINDSVKVFERAKQRETAAAEKAAQAQARAAERAAEMERKSIRTVESEMERLRKLAINRSITAQARAQLGASGPSILTGHGFTNKARQTLGLMRDLTVSGMGLRYTAGAIAGAVGSVVAPAADLQDTLAKIQTKGRYSDQEIQQIREAALTEGRKQFGANAAASAGVELAASGLSATQTRQALPTVLKFAQAGSIDTETSAQTLVETGAQFNIQAQNFERIGNVITRAANLSTIEVRDMNESLKYVGPIAHTAGMSLEDTATAIALLGERGVKGSQAGTGLRKMFTSLVYPAKQAKTAMAELGITQKQLQEGMRDIPAFMARLDAMMSKRGLNQAQRLSITKRLFGTEGLVAAEIMTDVATRKLADGRTAWEQYNESIKTADGELNTTAAKLGATFNKRLEKVQAAWENAKISMGTSLMPALEAQMPNVEKAMDLVGKVIGENLGLSVATAIGGTVVVAALAKAAVAALATVAAPIAGVLAGAIYTAFFAKGFYDLIKNGAKTKEQRGALPEDAVGPAYADADKDVKFQGFIATKRKRDAEAQQEAEKNAIAALESAVKAPKPSKSEPWAGRLDINIAHGRGAVPKTLLDIPGNGPLNVGVSVLP